MANDVPLTGMTPSALWRLQQILIAQEEAAAEQRRAEVRKLELANDPLEEAKQQAAVEMLRNRRDVRPMSLPEEADFLGAGAPLGGGVEAMRPRSGVPLGPIVGPPAGQGGIERGITAPRFDESQSLGTIVPRVRGGKPHITEGQSTPRQGPSVRLRMAFTDRDTPITELRQQAERATDPNFAGAMRGRQTESMSTMFSNPSVASAAIAGQAGLAREKLRSQAASALQAARDAARMEQILAQGQTATEITARREAARVRIAQAKTAVDLINAQVQAERFAPGVGQRMFGGLDDEMSQQLVEAQRLMSELGQTTPVPNSGGVGTSGTRVPVIAPDGSRGTIPAEQLDQAIREGYRRAN